MNLSEMSTFVRAQADTDEVDAPDATLTVYARAAYRDIQARVFGWPDKRTTFQVTTVAGTSSYGMSGLTPATMDFLISAVIDDDVLVYASPERMRELRTRQASSGSPTVYTVDGSDIVFWPTPSAAETVSFTGYRDFLEWPSGSDEPDLPRGFDEVICWYMLSRFYQAQEDLELADMYMRDYNIGVNQQIEKALRTSTLTAGPMIFGGDPELTAALSYEDWVKRSVEG
jgi:hypothetical protein